jgi:hypothetical protein
MHTHTCCSTVSRNAPASFLYRPHNNRSCSRKLSPAFRVLLNNTAVYPYDVTTTNVVEQVVAQPLDKLPYSRSCLSHGYTRATFARFGWPTWYHMSSQSPGSGSAAKLCSVPEASTRASLFGMSQHKRLATSGHQAYRASSAELEAEQMHPPQPLVHLPHSPVHNNKLCSKRLRSLAASAHLP